LGISFILQICGEDNECNGFLLEKQFRKTADDRESPLSKEAKKFNVAEQFKLSKISV